jgi:demethylmenaquinone methyltransferase/2-methoxy-6-polyprenyl-1,4-benzoquinol methylase
MNAEQRTRVVKDIFTTAHRSYDLLNRLLSLRRDVGWRKNTVRRMRFSRTMRFLDIATGTADLAIEAANRNPGIRVSGVDFAEPMLGVGRRKVEALGLADRIELSWADAVALPFPDSSFDVAAIAFGMRNIPDKARALGEMARVTVPGGQVMVLEFTFAPKGAFRAIYGLYLRRILPGFARIYVRNAAPYYYLADSIMKFPKPDDFDQLMRQAGLVDVVHRSLTFGVTYLHIGRRPLRASEGS